MPIIINIDVMLAKRKMQSQELAEKISLINNIIIPINMESKGVPIP